MAGSPDSNNGRSRGLALFDDQPGGEIDKANDPFRLAKTAEVIKRLLDDAIGEKRYPCIGLFGGLGQGKTTILKSVEAQMKVSDIRCEFFDAANYQPDILEFEFDRLVARWWFGRSLLIFFLLLLPLAVTALWGAHVAAGITGHFLGLGYWESLSLVLGTPAAILAGRIVSGAGRAALGVVNAPAIKHWLRDVERNGGFGRFGRCLLPSSRPSVLFIDNLDRASVPQQRSVLRAIHKHQRSLKLPVVVAMDVGGLFTAKPDPEAADELLRKVVDVAVHMPPRIAEDIAEIVVTLAKEGAARNPGTSTAVVLSDPRVLGDLARVFALLPGFGPRRVKRFLNDLMVVRELLGLPFCCDETAAAIRMIALFSVAPALREYGDELISALAVQEDGDLEVLLERVVGEPDRDYLKRIFLGSRHMQPADRHWRRVLAVMSHEVRKNSSVGAAGLCGRVAEWAAAVADGRHGLHWPAAGSKISAEPNNAFLANAPPFPDHFAKAWAALEVALARQCQPQARLRLYRQFRNAPEQFTDPVMPSGTHDRTADHVELQFCRDVGIAMLLRLWVGDWEVLAAMMPDARNDLFREVSGHLSPSVRQLLFIVPGRYVRPIDRLTLLADDAIGGAFDTRTFATWLRGELVDGDAPDLWEGRARFSMAKFGPLPLIWPGFSQEHRDITDPICRAELIWHFDLIRLAGERGVLVATHGVREALLNRRWLERNLVHKAELVQALRHLFPEPGDRLDRPQIRDLSAFITLFQNETKGKGDIIRLMVDEAESTDDHHGWWLALHLACDAEMFEDVVPRLLASLPPRVRSIPCDESLLEALLDRTCDPLWRVETISLHTIVQLFGHLIATVPAPERHLVAGLHDRLRIRNDYGDFLRSTKAWAPLPYAGIDRDGAARPLYSAHLAAVRAAGVSSVTRMTAELLCGYRCETIAVESRVLFDALALLGCLVPDQWSLRWASSEQVMHLAQSGDSLQRELCLRHEKMMSMISRKWAGIDVDLADEYPDRLVEGIRYVTPVISAAEMRALVSAVTCRVRDEYYRECLSNLQELTAGQTECTAGPPAGERGLQ